MMRLLFLFWLFRSLSSAAVLGSLVPAANYYVDQGSGSDTNPGTSRQQAFATLTKAQSVAAAGQVIAISGGPNVSSPYRYREEFTVPGVSVSLVGYGVAQPLIDCSDTISTGTWSKTPGYTNIYQATAPITSGVNGFLRVWENDVALLRPATATMAGLDATAGKYLTSADPTSGAPISSVTLYVHTSDNANPASNGKTYDYNARQSAIYSLSAKTLVSNVHLRRNLANEGSLKIGDDSFVSDAILEEGIIHNTVVGEGAYWQNVHMLNSYYGGQGKIALVLNDTVATGKNATFQNVSYDESVETGGQGFFGHVNISGAFGVVSLLNCSTTGTSSSIGGFDSSTTIINGGSYDGGISIASNTKLLNLTLGGQIAIPYPNTTAEIGNVVSTGNFTNGNIFVQNNVTGLSLNVHDSTFRNDKAFDGAIYVGSGASFNSFSSQHNTFLSSVQTGHLLGPGTADLPLASTIDYNTYHYPGTSSWILYRGGTYDISSSGWAAWLALGFDAHGNRVTP